MRLDDPSEKPSETQPELRAIEQAVDQIEIEAVTTKRRLSLLERAMFGIENPKGTARLLRDEPKEVKVGYATKIWQTLLGVVCRSEPRQ